MINDTEISQIKKTLRNSIDNDYIAGANLMIIKDGKEIFYHEDGWADKEAGIPIKRDSIFRLYSMTKPVTAAGVMIQIGRAHV